MTAGPSGTGVVKEVKVRVVEPTPTLEFFTDKYTSTMTNPNIFGGVASGTGVAVTGTYTRQQQIVRSGNTITIEKPVASGADITFEWFTVLTNWQSALVRDTLLLSNDSLKTPSQREYFVSGDGVKDGLSNYAGAEKVLAINTLNNLVTADIKQIAGVLNNEDVNAGGQTLGIKDAVKYAVKKDADDDGTGFTSSALADTSDAEALFAAATAIPSDGIITIDPSLSIASTVSVNATKAYTIRVYNSAAAGNDGNADNYNDIPFVVVTSKIPNFVELGGDTDIFPTSPAGGGFKFVNFEMSTTGPSNLFAGIPSVKAAIALSANEDGLVLVEQATSDVSEATINKYKPGLSFDVTTAPGAIVDGQASDQFGFRRDPLKITNTTVAGTYTMVFKVDTLELPITIIINNPQPKLFVLSGTVGTSPAVRVSTPTANGENVTFSTSSTASEFIKFFDATGELNEAADFVNLEAADVNDLFASSSTGVFTVDLKSNYAAANSGFYGRLAIADLPKGVYNFKVVKSYPDGRVETKEDRAEVTGHDTNGIALFGDPTQLNVNNTVFLNNFLINELAYVKGTYVFEFTIGTVSKKYTINVVDLPSLAATTLKVGTATTDLFSGEYILKPQTIGGKILMDFTKKNLTDAQYVSVDAASLIGADFTPVVETKIALKDLTQLELGTLTSAARSNGDKIYFTLKFWNKVPFSTSSSLYTRVGEDQVVVVGFINEFDTTTTPTMTLQAPSSVATTSATINYTTVGTGNIEVRYINQLSSVAAPTRNAVANGTVITAAAAGVKTLTGLTLVAGSTYTIYMIAIDAADNLANNVVSLTYSTLPTSATAYVNTNLLESATPGVLDVTKDSVTLTLTGATFAADIATANVTAASLPAGLDFIVTRTSGTVLTIKINETATADITADVTGITFTVSKAKIILANGSNPSGDLVSGNLTITAAS
jgi:hypothetical protein